MAMGFPLSPVFGNFFMEDLEKRAQSNYKLLCWFHYVDTFDIWPHGTEKLERFLNLLNGLHRNIQFTMEIKGDGHLPFLDIDIYRRLEGSLGHKAYQKPTHNYLYLNPGSRLHSSNIQAILSMLVHRARVLCNKESSMMSWSSSKPLSGKMVIVSNRYDGPSTWQLEPLSWKRSPTWSLFFHMSRWHKASSAECWPNTTTNGLACCLGRSPVSFILWRMTWDWGLRGFTGYPKNF